MQVTGPGEIVEYSQTDQASGKLAFTASEGGAHQVCFFNSNPVARRIELDFASGVDAKDYGEIAKKEHLKPLEVRRRHSCYSLIVCPAVCVYPVLQLELRKLEDRVEGVHREMLYQREREESHRNTNESTNARVMWFSVLSIVIVLTISAGQIWFLYTFFKRKKFL